MPALVYTVSPFVPFTKISSSDVNQYFTDIKNRVNWSGGTDTTTGLGDTNIQSVAASGGGLTRATKLKLGTANHVVINDGTGAMSSESALALSRGGTGASLTIGTTGQTLQVSSGGAIVIADAPIAPQSRVYSYYKFTF